MRRRVLSALALPVWVSVTAAAAAVGFQVGAPAGRHALETRLRGSLPGSALADRGVRGELGAGESPERWNMWELQRLLGVRHAWKTHVPGDYSTRGGSPAPEGIQAGHPAEGGEGSDAPGLSVCP